MKCPACETSLRKINQENIELDVCSLGCGGIWFDNKEIEKFDDKSDPIDCNVLFSGKNQNNKVIDYSKRRVCPICFIDLKVNKYHLDNFDLELDECEKCSGVWLDAGELNTLRTLRKEDAHMDKIFNDFCSKYKENMSNNIKAVFTLLFK